MNELTSLSITEMVRLVRARSVSPLEFHSSHPKSRSESLEILSLLAL